jgi:hypothetical protein
MHKYPGPGMFPASKDRATVLGEYGGLGLPVKGHLWQDKGNWGYETYPDVPALSAAYRRLTRKLHPLVGKGLSAAVYTQTTDVEGEVNGLMTYDRAVIKMDPAAVAGWHAELKGPPPVTTELVPTSERAAQTWVYTFRPPAGDWTTDGGDDWKTGPGGFGTTGTPGAVVGTAWTGPDIWLRQEFELAAVPAGEVVLRMHHDDAAEVFLNGVLAAKVSRWATGYGEFAVRPEAVAALKPGRNVLAVHCHQDKGGQFIDVGLSVVAAAR